MRNEVRDHGACVDHRFLPMDSAEWQLSSSSSKDTKSFYTLVMRGVDRKPSPPCLERRLSSWVT